jgi:hypothetical protein
VCITSIQAGKRRNINSRSEASAMDELLYSPLALVGSRDLPPLKPSHESFDISKKNLDTSPFMPLWNRIMDSSFDRTSV